MQASTVDDPNLEKIKQRLTQALSVTDLVLVDDSAQHQGHAEFKGQTASHLKLFIISPDFQGKSPLERHRLIYAALGDLMGTLIHAIHIQTNTPDEWTVKEAKDV
jgi:BolA family transcriptional regulator, general stress-responsive regulator